MTSSACPLAVMRRRPDTCSAATQTITYGKGRTSQKAEPTAQMTYQSTRGNTWVRNLIKGLVLGPNQRRTSVPAIGVLPMCLAEFEHCREPVFPCAVHTPRFSTEMWKSITLSLSYLCMQNIWDRHLFMSILKALYKEDEEERYTGSHIQRASSASWTNSDLEVMGFRLHAWLFEIWSILGGNRCIFHETDLCILRATFYGGSLDGLHQWMTALGFHGPCVVPSLTAS